MQVPLIFKCPDLFIPVMYTDSYEYWRVITLTEIRRILQIEENISISRHTLTCGKGHGRCTFPSRITIPRKVQVKLSTNLHY